MENPQNMLEHIKDDLDSISRQIYTLTPDDIPGLGKILNVLDAIEKKTDQTLYDDFLFVIGLTRKYIEKIVLGEDTDVDPLRDSMLLLRAMAKRFTKGKSFTFGIDDVIEQLGGRLEIEKPVAKPMEPLPDSPPHPLKELENEDLEILGDFIIESRENLETIEVNLIDLEENPEDSEIINAIFRPFHTIKGISGFLDLRKINALSHATENLLDSVRMGHLTIDHEITDVILQSVDMLKKLIDTVEAGHKIGMSADDRDVNIDTLAHRIEKLNSSSQSIQEKPARMGEILVKNGIIEEEQLSEALEIQKENPDKKLGEILVEDQGTESRDVISALREQKRSRKPGALQVKVDTGKLDNLVDLTGELVIAQSMLRQEALQISGSGLKLSQNLNHLAQIVSSIQKIAMSMRMVPISATFQKMVRLVRDLAKSCKKDVSLIMTGEETEIDRNVVEALYEPMVHMIRNSIDHGLESEAERKKAGKPEKGTVSLKAYHKGGNIVIEISDNGKGLSTLNILEKAIDIGLIDKDTDLSDQEIYQLIMKPGFSTAKAVTDISGRGVGMDVVKRAIENLNGQLDIRSVEGQGSTFIITLPLTLAIIEGMLIRVGNERFIVPTMTILESFRPRKEDYFTVKGKGEMLMFRKSLVPVIRLNTICNVRMDHTDVWKNIAIVVENNKELRGLLIDELLGKEEFVIKSLGESLKGIKGLAGGTILGDGKVGLILDIAGLFEIALGN
ncbi:MAG: chemotaxis protein CheA [Desulfobacteraceae bacterium]|nr:chemotaxis protein CheA [Desulfobacteraceae bacterium]